MPVVVLTTAKIIGEKRKINHVEVLIVFGLLLQQTGRSCEWAAQTTYRLNETIQRSEVPVDMPLL